MEILCLPQNSRPRWNHTRSRMALWSRGTPVRQLTSLLGNHAAGRFCSRIFLSLQATVRRASTWRILSMSKNSGHQSTLLGRLLNLSLSKNSVSWLVYVSIYEILWVCSARPSVVTFTAAPGTTIARVFCAVVFASSHPLCSWSSRPLCLGIWSRNTIEVDIIQYNKSDVWCEHGLQRIASVHKICSI